MSIDWKAPAGLAAALALTLGGCGEPDAPAEDAPGPATEMASPAPAPASLADVFPEGPGQSMVLDNCGSCHAAACSAIGQRTEARWANLKEDHRDKVAEMSGEDFDALFAYLSENFNDAKPEPVVPPQFLEGGCTPF